MIKNIKGGCKNKLSLENQLLMTLEYIREYRTYFHISKSHGISQITAYKTERLVEDALIKYPDFALLGRKALLKSNVEYELILVDASETPIERPKKRVRNKKRVKTEIINKSIFIAEKRRDIL